MNLEGANSGGLGDGSPPAGSRGAEADDFSQLKGHLWHLGEGDMAPLPPPLKSASGISYRIVSCRVCMPDLPVALRVQRVPLPGHRDPVPSDARLAPARPTPGRSTLVRRRRRLRRHAAPADRRRQHAGRPPRLVAGPPRRRLPAAEAAAAAGDPRTDCLTSY